jgi:probable HAF family extracellular repeat protein
MTRWGAAAAALGLAATLAPIDGAGATSAPARTYEVVDLGVLPGALSSHGNAINDDGVVVGWSDFGDMVSHAFLWRDGHMTDLGTLVGPSGISEATDISDRGLVVGVSTTADGGYHPVLWRDGRIVDLGTLGGSSGKATGVNDAGDVVGFSETASGETHAFRWRRGRMTDLGTVPGQGFSSAEAVDGDGRAVGESGGPVVWRRSEPALLPLVPEADSAAALDTNDRGTTIVGYSLMPGGASINRAVMWRHGVPTDLGLERGSSHATGVNDRNQVVGSRELEPLEGSGPFLWEDGRVTMLPALGGGGGGGAAGINNSGVIVGTSPDPADLNYAHAVIWR